VGKFWRRIFAPVTDDVRLELIGALFETRVPIAIAGATLALVLFHSAVAADTPALFVLGTATILVTIGRLMLNGAYTKSKPAAPDIRAAEIWEQRYAIGSFVFSALIGAAGALAFRNGDGGHQLLATALVFGYAAGAVCRISIRPAMCLPVLVLAALPTAFSAMARLDADHLFYGAILLAILVGSVETVRFLYNVNVEQISLKHDFAALARHDALTGLANRLGFKERLKRAARRAHDQGDMIAVHSIDLDRFKEANDRYGHPAGDALLQAVAGRLGGMLRDDDFAVRLGGDEFVIVQTAVGHSQEALLLARRAIATLNEPFAVDGHEIEIGASIGIAVGSQMADVETLMSAADKALYKSKSNGRNRASFAQLAEAALSRTA
jgi:diguanylate cyclase (GGDEF)-like protein